ncbi:TPA: hypothetical protein DCZ39_01325 [Patescibacteria group bacterium]|nr:hypothetical protein [Candidatus Gracilibacteria bacterium]
MKFELVFIRHGESTGNAIHETHNKDIDFLLELTEKGKQQASITKETLQNETFDSIFCSDMIRTKQTAEIIFGDTYDILYDERLREAFLSTDKDFVINYKEIPKTERVPMRLK